MLGVEQRDEFLGRRRESRGRRPGRWQRRAANTAERPARQRRRHDTQTVIMSSLEPKGGRVPLPLALMLTTATGARQRRGPTSTDEQRVVFVEARLARPAGTPLRRAATTRTPRTPATTAVPSRCGRDERALHRARRCVRRAGRGRRAADRRAPPGWRPAWRPASASPLIAVSRSIAGCTSRSSRADERLDAAWRAEPRRRWRPPG